MLKLLGRVSSINVRKVLWTLDEVGLPYAREDWGAGFRSPDDPAFRALNPNAMVPVLIDGDAVVWESNTICRYLAGRAGRTDLLPADPVARAGVEQWMDWQAGDLNNAWRPAYMTLVKGAGFDAATVAASVAAWNGFMRILDDRLARTGSFVAGPTFTLADVVLGLSAYRWTMTPMDRPDLPAVTRYLDRLSARPGYRTHGGNGLP